MAGVRGRRMARPAGRAEAGGWRLERRRGRVEPRTGRRRRREQLKRRSDREPGAAATGGTRSRVCLILFYFFVYIHMDCVLQYIHIALLDQRPSHKFFFSFPLLFDPINFPETKSRVRRFD